MGTLYLLRHGQASLGAQDYDQLSELGHRQCQMLGAYWQARQMRFDAVLCGGLRRHAQSLAAVQEGLNPETALVPQIWPELNEYDSEALIRSVLADGAVLARPQSAEAARAYFRLLREGLRAWMSGQTQPEGMATYADFTAGVAAALTHVREHCEGQVLLVSSGGPIACAIAQVLALPAESVIELNLRLRNSAVSEMTFNPKRLALQTFNTLPHLETPEAAHLISAA